MIVPGKNKLLIKLYEPEKKPGSIILVKEESDPIVSCQILGAQGLRYETPSRLGYFRRYDLRDCVDKNLKYYVVDEDALLAYEDAEPTC